MNKTVREIEKETSDTRQHVERKIEANRDTLVKHTDQIVDVQKGVSDLKDVVMKSKRSLA